MADPARPARTLRAGRHELALGERPLLMGIVNASPESFSDGGAYPTLDDQLERAAELLEAGADMIDVGGESGVTNVPSLPADEEIARVVPLVARVAGELDALVSVDTWKVAVAEAALDAGASIVNDVSGLRDPAIADVCAVRGAALVIMHTRAEPKRRLAEPKYDDVMDDVLAFLRERMEVAASRGVAAEQLILDPGPDFAKTPAQTVAVLRELPRLHELGRPLLLALSRKDFIGALTGRRPRARLAGTLAALGHALDAGGHIFRVHDVREAADYIAVWRALRGEVEVPADLALADELRHERGPG